MSSLLHAGILPKITPGTTSAPRESFIIEQPFGVGAGPENATRLGQASKFTIGCSQTSVGVGVGIGVGVGVGVGDGDGGGGL